VPMAGFEPATSMGVIHVLYPLSYIGTGYEDMHRSL
jgi:hypothetical protein